jgi:hypothetical protein
MWGVEIGLLYEVELICLILRRKEEKDRKEKNT